MPFDLLQSPLLQGLGFLHGFSTRAGGASAGAFASLNLGGSVGDDPEAVEANHRILAAAAGIERAAFRSATQVHGTELLVLGSEKRPPPTEADALVATIPGLAVGVRTADCVPILLAHRPSGKVAAVHAGWRGTLVEIAGKAVATLAAAGCPPRELAAAIGPAIGPCCYEVSEELAETFSARWSAEAKGRALDLPRINQLQLLAAGIPADHIDPLSLCTSCDEARFFSHRRDRGKTGRHLSFVVSP